MPGCPSSCPEHASPLGPDPTYWGHSVSGMHSTDIAHARTPEPATGDRLALVRAGHRDDRGLHGPRRRHHRQHRRPVDPARRGRQLQPDPVDHRRLRARLRRRSGHRRTARRHPRPQADLPARHRRLHRRLRPVRVRREPRDAGRLPHPPGRHGRADGAAGAVHRARHLPGARTRQGLRTVRRDRRPRRGVRTAPRRAADPGQPLRAGMAADLPHQPARRRRRPGPRQPLHHRVQGAARPEARPARRRPRHPSPCSCCSTRSPAAASWAGRCGVTCRWPARSSCSRPWWRTSGPRAPGTGPR